jgi:hypothetical protein
MSADNYFLPRDLLIAAIRLVDRFNVPLLQEIKEVFGSLPVDTFRFGPLYPQPERPHLSVDVDDHHLMRTMSTEALLRHHDELIAGVTTDANRTTSLALKYLQFRLLRFHDLSSSSSRPELLDKVIQFAETYPQWFAMGPNVKNEPLALRIIRPNTRESRCLLVNPLVSVTFLIKMIDEGERAYYELSRHPRCQRVLMHYIDRTKSKASHADEVTKALKVIQEFCETPRVRCDHLNGHFFEFNAHTWKLLLKNLDTAKISVRWFTSHFTKDASRHDLQCQKVNLRVLANPHLGENVIDQIVDSLSPELRLKTKSHLLRNKSLSGEFFERRPELFDEQDLDRLVEQNYHLSVPFILRRYHRSQATSVDVHAAERKFNIRKVFLRNVILPTWLMQRAVIRQLNLPLPSYLAIE